MIYDLLYKFLHILPTKLFGIFSSRTVSFANHSKFNAKERHQSSSTRSFENFQIATHEFPGFQFLEKCWTFHFGQFLTHPKKIQGILEKLNKLFLDTFPRTLSENM